MQVVGKLGSDQIVALSEGEYRVTNSVLAHLAGLETAAPAALAAAEPQRVKPPRKAAARRTAKSAGRKNAPRNKNSREKCCATCKRVFLDQSRTNTRKWCDKCTELPRDRHGQPIASAAPGAKGKPVAGDPASREARVDLIRRVAEKVAGTQHADEPADPAEA